MKKFFKIKEGPLVYFSSEHGPCFGEGGTDFYINGDLNEGFTINNSFLKNSELTNGESGKFNVSELEIFKVI